MRHKDSPEFDRAVDRWVKTGLTGVILMAPIPIGVAVEAPLTLLFAYWMVATAALAVVILRSRSGRER